MQTGNCATESLVLYMSSSGTGNACTHVQPCGSLTTALGLVDATHKTIKMLAGSYSLTATATITDKSVTVHGDGADLTATSQGEILRIEGAANVSLFGLRIHNGLGTSGDGILCINVGANNPTLNLTKVSIDTNGGIGVDATKCTLTITQSKVSGNIGGGVSSAGGMLTVAQSTLNKNTGGGINVSAGAVFVVVGNVFFSNGSIDSTIGGITILTTQSALNRLEFNSFHKNQTQNNVGSAIQCTAGTFEARNNIMSVNGTQTNLEQTGGSCTHAYSIALPGTLPAGGTNIASDPLFKDTVTGDLHIQLGSPAIRAAAPGSDLTGIAAHDIDGDTRVNPADLGAYELPR